MLLIGLITRNETHMRKTNDIVDYDLKFLKISIPTKII